MRYIERFEIRWLIYSVLALFVAVLSNFTALLPMAAIGFVWFLLMLINKKGGLLFTHSLIWIIAAVILVWWSEYPIRIMADAREFTWGSKSTLSMIHNLVDNLMYGFYDLKNLAVFTLFLITLGFFIAIGVFALVVEHLHSKRQLRMTLCILFFTLVFIALNQMITESNAPIGRQSLFIIPILFVPLSLGLNLITHKSLIFSFSVLISGVLLYHSFRSHPWAAVREWYYDAYYPELFASLPASYTVDSIRLGSSWIFTPSLHFYQKVNLLSISGLVYQKPLVIDSTMQYYYVEAGDTTQMGTFGFVLQKSVGPFFLFTNVSNPLRLDAPLH